jgi:hypothetical protein
VFVTTLFILFSAIEIGIFMDKIHTSQQEQIKYNADNDKKFHNLESDFKTLKDEYGQWRYVWSEVVTVDVFK